MTSPRGPRGPQYDVRKRGTDAQSSPVSTPALASVLWPILERHCVSAETPMVESFLGVENRSLPYLPTDPNSTLRQWVEWMHFLSDAPSSYSALAYLTTLAACIDREWGLVQQPGGQLVRPTLFTMLIGASGHRKSYAINTLSSCFHYASKERYGLGAQLGVLPGAPPGMGPKRGRPREDAIELDAVNIADSQFGSTASLGELLTKCANKHAMVMYNTELSTQFSAPTARHAGPLAKLQEMLNKTFDQEKITVSYRDSEKRIFAENYALSMLGGMNLQQLSDVFTTADIDGGFLARWLVTHPPSVRLKSPVPPPVELTEEMTGMNGVFTERWRARLQTPPGGFVLTREANERLADWSFHDKSRYKEQFLHKTGKAFSGFFNRLDALLVRIASLYAFDRTLDNQRMGIVNPENYWKNRRNPHAPGHVMPMAVVTETDMELAINLLNYEQIPGMQALALFVPSSTDRDARERHRVRALFLDGTRTKRSPKDVAKTLELTVKAAASALQHWYQVGVLMQESSGSEFLYSLSEDMSQKAQTTQVAPSPQPTATPAAQMPVTVAQVSQASTQIQRPRYDEDDVDPYDDYDGE